MIAIRSYATSLAAELARLPLEEAGIPNTVVGVDASMQGGLGGVQLLVPEEYAKAALALLDKV
jgi:hypothetical protein